MAADRRPVSAEDILSIHALSSLTLHPGGRLLAFTDRVPDQASDGYRARVQVLDLLTSEMRPFTSAEYSSHSPAWSPDGQELGFLSKRGGGPAQLWTLPAAGGEPRQLTGLKRGVDGFCWSPDGGSICLIASTGAPIGEKDDPMAPRVIETLRYKFNGRGFTYNRRRHLFVISREGGEVLQLTDGPWEDSDPAWSPDGAFIAFSSARHDDFEFDLASDIYIVPSAGGEVRRITQTMGGAASPAFSPDGEWIAYAGTERSESMPSHRRVLLVPTAGGSQQALGELDRTLHADAGLTWSQDGARIYGLNEDEGRVALLGLEVGTGAVLGDRETPQQILDYVLTADGQAVFIATSATRPSEVYRAPFTGGRLEMERLTGFHDEWLSEVAISEMQPFTARSQDGTEVPCWIVAPEGAAAAAPESTPGLLKIHGGPYAQFGYAFSHEFQWFVSQGYAVFLCNPRGSAGYSEEWARSLGRQRGITDYEDVMSCTDQALAQFPFIDPERLAVNGGSYGGYMTSWIVGHTDRFKVACSEAAPNNLYSMSGSSDLAGSNHRLVYGFTAQEDPVFYQERSPISYAKNIVTPLLIIHSEEDLRVSIEQGEQLFVALRLLRRKVRFVRFPGENHGLPRGGRPSHRLQRLGFIRDWFDEHLSLRAEPLGVEGEAASP